MGYIGQAPANKAVTSADIEDSAITSAKILDGTIVNADVNASAAIAESKLSVTAFDDTKLRQDIASLALHSAVADNKTAHNLPNMFVEQFQDDTGIATETTGDRHTDEYWSSTIGSPVAANSQLLLHFEDGVAVDSGTTGHTIGNVGSPTQSTTQVKFGTYSMYAGSGKYLTVPKHSDFAFGSGVWTIDWWWWSAYSGGADNWIFDYTSGSNGFGFRRDGAGGLDFYWNGSNVLNQGNDDDWTASTWTHWALTHTGGTIKLYKNGTEIESFASGGAMVVPADGTVIKIGTLNSGSMNNYIDEFRISQVLRWSSNFTPETSAYDSQTVSATGTLISNASVASAAQTKVSGVMLYKDNAGTATIGTDLKIYFSCDNGSNWTEAASYGTVSPVFSTGVKMIRLGDTTCTSGTQVKYKAVWANQASGSKETQLHGIGMNY